MKEVDHQSANGGNQSKDVEVINRGPLWSKEGWSVYTANTIAMAATGCLHQKELEAHINAVTSEKQTRGELI